MPTFSNGELGSSVREKINAAILAVEQGGLGRNRIINGGMRVDQRFAGGSQTFTAGAALAYTVDRWYGYCTGANITGQRIALSNGQNRYRFTGAASNTGVGFAQRIEAANSLDLADQNVTLQVKLSSSSLTSVGWALYYANTTDTFGTLASPTRTLISSGTFTITSTEAVYSATVAVPSAAITGLEFVLTGGALLASQTLTIGDVQIEPGLQITPFARASFHSVFTECARYFQTTKGVAFQVIGIGNGSATTIDVPYRLLVPMRISPSLSLSGTIGTFLLTDASTSPAATNVVIQDGTSPGASIVNLRWTTSGLVAGRAVKVYVNNSASTGLNFDAEL